MVVFDMASEEFTSLLKENQELKKQLKPNYYIEGLEETLKEYQQEMNKVAIQQKEFIKYLEDEIKSCELICNLIFNRNKEMKIYKEILQKYKEITGVSDENNKQ